MTKFIENVNLFLSQMKIKQTFISSVTGIDSKKLSRILTGVQDISATDMEKLAFALGQDVPYFLKEPFEVPNIAAAWPERISFYVNRPATKESEAVMDNLERLLEMADQILSAKGRFLNIGMEDPYGYKLLS